MTSVDNQIQLKKMFEYNLSANSRLIEICSQLTDEQRMVETEGVSGNIRHLLTHLLRSEGGYAKRLIGAPLWADDLDWGGMSMGDLAEKAQISGKALIEIAGKTDPTIRHDVIRDNGEPFYFFNWTVTLQALYHGIEHRTQIKVLLTKLGVEHPNLAAWDYMETLL